MVKGLFAIAIALVIPVALPEAGNMFSSDAAPVAPGLAPLDVEYLPEYVIGFPVHAAVVVRCAAPHSTVGPVPYADVFSAGGAFGLKMEDSERKLIAQANPLPITDQDLGPSRIWITSEEPRRMLIDISPFLPLALAPGDYRISLSYGPTMLRVASRWAEIRFREPNSTEKAELAVVQPELTKTTWGLWTKKKPPNPVSVSQRVAFTDPAALNRVLRALFFAPKLDPDQLGALTGIYSPEAAVLRVELMKIAGNPAWEESAQQTRAAYPGLSWWLDDVAGDRSPVIFYRSLL